MYKITIVSDTLDDEVIIEEETLSWLAMEIAQRCIMEWWTSDEIEIFD